MKQHMLLLVIRFFYIKNEEGQRFIAPLLKIIPTAISEIRSEISDMVVPSVLERSDPLFLDLDSETWGLPRNQPALLGNRLPRWSNFS